MSKCGKLKLDKKIYFLIMVKRKVKQGRQKK